MLSLFSKQVRLTTGKAFLPSNLAALGLSASMKVHGLQYPANANPSPIIQNCAAYYSTHVQRVLLQDTNDSNKAKHLQDNNGGNENPNNTKPVNNDDGDSATPPPEDGNDGPGGKKSDKPKKLQTVPLVSMKLEMTEAEQKLKPDGYLLFSSSYPILPYNKQPGLIKTGHLQVQHMNQPISYFLVNEKDELFTIGYILDTNINKEIKKSAPKHHGEETAEKSTLGDTSASITTKKGNQRVKLVEIIKENDCVFCKAIPYKDRKLTAEEKKINIDNEMVTIANYALSLRRLVSLERIELFNDIDFSNPKATFTGLTKDQSDEYIFKFLLDLMKLSYYTKENMIYFVQMIIEERSFVNRVLLMRKKIEEFYKIIELVHTNFRLAEDQLIRMTAQQRARLSMEYIRSAYLAAANTPPVGFGSNAPRNEKPHGTGHAGGQSGPRPEHNLTGIAKEYYDKLHLIKDPASREKVRKEIERFSMLDKLNSDYHKIHTYLDEIFSIPWDHHTEEFWDAKYTQEVLDKRIYGLEKVKERIVEMVAVNKLKRIIQNRKDRKGFIVLLYGPPGVGKTSIAKTIGEALKRETRFISFAGVTDPHFIKGHRRTYVDSQPGIFVKELIKSRTMNPVFVVDEIDKLTKGTMGADPYYSLMEILNPEENANFVDHYMDIKVDFSQVIFILTANNILNMADPLRNRLEIIDIPSYIESEKLEIAKKHLIPKVLESHGLMPDSIRFDDDTVTKIIKGWCYYETGVRNLQRCFERISRKYAVELQERLATEEKRHEDIIISQTPTSTLAEVVPNPAEAIGPAGAKPIVTVGQPAPGHAAPDMTVFHNKEPAHKPHPVPPQPYHHPGISVVQQNPLIFSGEGNMELLKKYLGNPVFDEDYEREKKLRNPVGVVNVLTVGGFTGNVLHVECVYDPTHTDKKGRLSASGNLKKVLQESLQVAKINAYRHLTPEQVKYAIDQNIHVHFMNGAVPKDGPSAGISICTAYLSLLLNKKIPSDLSMTGELSLNGEVWKIGGVQAKVTASKALDITRIILPYGNMGDFIELPKTLQQSLTVYFVKEYKEVFAIAFGEADQDFTGQIDMIKNGVYYKATNSGIQSFPTSADFNPPANPMTATSSNPNPRE